MAKTSLFSRGQVVKNYLINGSFLYWQRNTSFSLTTGYTSDRWRYETNGTPTGTISRQAFTVGQTDVPGNPTYFLRYNCTAFSGTYSQIEQRVENVSELAGKTVTLSFYAKASAAGNLSINARHIYGVGGSATEYTASTTVAITTTWARYSVKITLPSIAGKTIGANSSTGFQISFPTSAATVDLTQVMVNEGPESADFSLAGGTALGELTLCYRYFERRYNVFFPTWAEPSVNRVAGTRFSVPKRVIPTVQLSHDGTTANTVVEHSSGVVRTVTGISTVSVDGWEYAQLNIDMTNNLPQTMAFYSADAEL